MNESENASRRDFLKRLSLSGMTALLTSAVPLPVDGLLKGRTFASPSGPWPEALLIPKWLEGDGQFVFTYGMSGGIGEAASVGAQIVCGGTNAGGVGLVGGCYVWDGKERLYNVWTGETVDTGKVRETVDAIHRLGMKAVGELLRMWHPQMLYLEHPDWQELTSPDAKPLGPEHVKDSPPVTGCWNSPFGDFYIRQCVELIKQLGWDGYNLDGWGAWTTCYCRYCKESYRQETGKEIPYRVPQQKGQPGMQAVSPIEMIEDPEFRQQMKWRLNRYTQYVARWQKSIKDVKPEFAAMPWSTGPGRWWHWSFSPAVEAPDAANRLVDAPMVELFWDFPPDQGSNLLPSFTVRYYRGLAAERPVFMLPYFCTQGQQSVIAPKVESDFRVLTVLTNGAKAALFGGVQLPRDQPVEYLKGHLELIRSRERWVEGAESVKWAALLVSESSRLFYGLPRRHSEVAPGRWIGSGVDTPDLGVTAAHDRRLPAHMESAVGVFRAALEEHLPLDIIVGQDVEEGERLRKYRVLILPNAACLSQRELEEIQRFVEAGGGLVALQESSLYDEYGTRRTDFGLAELFQASFLAVEDHTAEWPNYPHPTSVALGEHAITEDEVIRGGYLAGRKELDYIGWTVKVKVGAGGEVLGRWGEKVAAPGSGGEGGEGEAFLVVSRRGKGRVVYYAGDVGQSYFAYPYAYERKLLARAMRWAGGEEGPEIEVEAPMCVQVTYYEQEGGKRKIVHLLNELNTTGDRGLPESNPSMREEVAKIGGIRVVFKGERLERAMLEPEHERLEMGRVDGGTEVMVPKLGLHSMVVAEGLKGSS